MSRPRTAVGDPLTDHEHTILRHVADGFSATEIGPLVWRSTDGVKSALRQVYRKLGARERAHAVHLAHQQGLLGVPVAAPRSSGRHDGITLDLTEETATCWCGASITADSYGHARDWWDAHRADAGRAVAS